MKRFWSSSPTILSAKRLISSLQRRQEYRRWAEAEEPSREEYA